MPQQNEEPEKESLGNELYVILGAIVLVVVVGAWYFLRSKGENPLTNTFVPSPVVPTPTPGPIAGLACEQQYYNPVIGFSQYYLSAEGADLTGSKKIDCTFNVSVNDKVITTDLAASPLTPLPQRGGDTFRCTTKKLELTPNVPTIVDVAIKSDRGGTATCSATFILPSP